MSDTSYVLSGYSDSGYIIDVLSTSGLSTELLGYGFENYDSSDYWSKTNLTSADTSYSIQSTADGPATEETQYSSENYNTDGFWYFIDPNPVVPEFQPSLGGGYYGSVFKQNLSKYVLKIQVSRNNKTWKHQSPTNIPNTTAKVIAKFLRQENCEVILLSSNLVNRETPEFEVKHVSTTKTR